MRGRNLIRRWPPFFRADFIVWAGGRACVPDAMRSNGFAVAPLYQRYLLNLKLRLPVSKNMKRD